MTARPESGPPAPYVGLRPFEFHEAALFYGRGEHIAEMVRTLRKWHFLAVVGSSGSGKSSLVRAGLLPAIASGCMNEGEGAADWRFVIMRPGLDPYENLLRELLPKLAPGQSLDPELVEFRRQTLRGGPRGLVEAIADSLLPEPARLVVLVDQFEEIFRFLERRGPGQPGEGRSLADRRNAALAFVDMLLATGAERDPQVYVVLTMRSEYLGDCEAVLGLSAAIAKSQFLTPRMTREQIQDIIERPIAAVGGRIEPKVVADLLNSLGTAQDQLPRVEHILLRMYKEARGSQPGRDQPVPLTPYDYRAAGGFESALDQHAEQLYYELGPGAKVGQPSERQRVAERLFRSLAVRSSQGTLVRRLSNLGEVASIAGTSEQIVVEVVEHFLQSGCNFLVATPSVPLNGNTTLDISHEALLRQWSRLSSWIENEAKSAEMYRSLADAAVRHAAGKASLWRGPDLQLALDWQAAEVPNKAWANRYHEFFDEAMAFLQKSKEARDFEIAEEEFQRRWRVPRGFIVGFVLALYLDSHYDLSLGSHDFWNNTIRSLVTSGTKVNQALLDIFRVTAHLAFFLGLIYFGKRIYRALRITAIRNEVASRALYSPAPVVYEKQYAGFWRRGGAAIIDLFVWYTLYGFLALLFVWVLRSSAIDDAFLGLWVGTMANLVLWLYEALMISSSRQATLGKMALGISVTDMNGDRVSFGRATGRLFAKLFLWPGSLIQPFTAKKQALHDKIAGCLVMYRPKQARRPGALL